MKLVTVAEMQQIEREADASGLTYERMMENAGRGLAEAVAAAYSHFELKSALGLVGSGNNGGDTLVALAHLAAQGWKVSAYLVRPRLEGDPLVARLLQVGGEILSAGQDAGYERLRSWIRQHSVLLDGVLGTGIRLPLREEVARALESARQALSEVEGVHVVAVDCPSGIDLDSGEAAPQVIQAELTVTMAAVKMGLLKFPAYRYVGRLVTVDIGLLEEDAGIDRRTWQSIRRFVPEPAQIRQLLPERPLDAHKGTFGTALIAAGSLNYTGAALLAGKAAYRIGAGLVTLAVPQPLHAALAGHFLEGTWVLLPHDQGAINAAAAEVLRKNLDRATALLLGPGFGTADGTKEFLNRLTGGQGAGRAGMGFVRPAAEAGDAAPVKLPPMVVDADGLKLLARLPEWAGRLPAPAVLTPHPGEMKILTGLSTGEIQADRLGVAGRFARDWGHVVVLKGAFTVVADPDGQAAIIPVASPALARAGTGDVLAGLIAGLMAQGVGAFDAAVASAWIHAQAGLRAAAALGNTASVLAGDLLEHIAPVLSELQKS